MTTGRQDASFASGLRQEAPSPTKTRWVILALLALAGLTLLAYFQPLPVLLLVVGVVVVALTWARPFWVFGGLLVLLPFHEQMLRVVTWQLGWTGVRVTALSLWKEAVIGLLLVRVDRTTRHRKATHPGQIVPIRSLAACLGAVLRHLYRGGGHPQHRPVRLS